jgi:predicted Zn-dependent peptidase
LIDFNKYQLDNGLTVLIHEDHKTPMAVVNTLYKVGSRNENPERTGFAHLFEHLMFGGSKNAPDFDFELQRVGGDNNAFTNTDITNYYITLPAQNIETALWLESDRMMYLNMNQRGLDIQKNVVVEEFKQRYLNQPYGDVWLHLRPLAYQAHPYRWATIGKDISHIETANLDDVVDFFNRYYHPANAIVVIAGHVDADQTIRMVDHWFGAIPGNTMKEDQVPPEPPQQGPRMQRTLAHVPQHAIYKAYHMAGRNAPHYYASDLTSDILGRGKSSYLYHTLVKERKVFNAVQAYVTGTVDPGLLIISGKVNEPHDIDDAHDLLNHLIHEFANQPVSPSSLEKVKNQAESAILISQAEILNRAIALAIAESLGNADLVNTELDLIRGVTVDDIETTTRSVLAEKNSNTLLYQSER